ncbi:hypothetical protein AY600_10715 [Phormidium willei BDU 130791]|nr:hypothetical protein AY600_10715 [Phormidium willei BDU 130791]
MKLPAEIIIPTSKLTRYLLVPRLKGDKSKFLAQAGFTLEESPALDSALRKLVRDYEAVFDRADEYGTYHRVTGNLEGLNGLHLAVVTIWIERTVNNSFQFVTLFPSKEKS